MKAVQEKYFEFVGKNLSVGEHEQSGITLHMIKHINKTELETLGKFRLIDDKDFGKEYRYFIPTDVADTRFEELEQLVSVKSGKNFAEAKKKRIAIERQMRAMAGDIVQFHLPMGKSAPAYAVDEILGIRKLADSADYSNEFGIALASGGCII